MHSHMVDIKIDFSQLSGLAEKKSVAVGQNQCIEQSVIIFPSVF